MMRNTATACVLISLTALSLTGCGKGTNGPETFPVTGRVTLGGEPVEGATVSFNPVSADVGVAGGQALTLADGSYDPFIVLDMGRSQKRGLPAGEYRVTVVKTEMPEEFTTMAPAPKNLLPLKYATTDSTPLTATVAPEGENSFDFSLEP